MRLPSTRGTSRSLFRSNLKGLTLTRSYRTAAQWQTPKKTIRARRVDPRGSVPYIREVFVISDHEPTPQAETVEAGAERIAHNAKREERRQAEADAAANANTTVGNNQNNSQQGNSRRSRRYGWAFGFLGLFRSVPLVFFISIFEYWKPKFYPGPNNQ